MCCTQGWVAFLPFHRLESDWSVLLYFHRSGTYMSMHWQTQWMTTLKSQATYHQIQTVAKGNSITESEAMFMKSMNRLKICDVRQGVYKLVGPVNHTPLSRQARHAALHFGHTRMKELATQLFQWIPPQAHALTRVYTKNRAGNRIVCLLRHRWSSVPCRRYVWGLLPLDSTGRRSRATWRRGPVCGMSCLSTTIPFTLIFLFLFSEGKWGVKWDGWVAAGAAKCLLTIPAKGRGDRDNLLVWDILGIVSLNSRGWNKLVMCN